VAFGNVGTLMTGIYLEYTSNTEQICAQGWESSQVFECPR
jgi:hypothetical protein